MIVYVRYKLDTWFNALAAYGNSRIGLYRG
jgi:hypothetical protein